MTYVRFAEERERAAARSRASLTPERCAWRDEAVALAREIAPAYALDWRLVAAVAILDGAWGESEATGRARNPFAFQARRGARSVALADGADGAHAVRGFDSLADAFRAFGRLVGRSPLYEEVREAGRQAGLGAMVRAIAPLYCPRDPLYAVKVMQVVALIDPDAREESPWMPS